MNVITSACRIYAVVPVAVRKFTVVFVGDAGDYYEAVQFPHDEGFVRAYVHALSIIGEKTHDYSDEADPFANFRECEGFDVPAELGVLIRMSDKFARLKNYFRKGTLRTRGEGVKDALVDIMNYCAVLYALLDNDRKE